MKAKLKYSNAKALKCHTKPTVCFFFIIVVVVLFFFSIFSLFCSFFLYKKHFTKKMKQRACYVHKLLCHTAHTYKYDMLFSFCSFFTSFFAFFRFLQRHKLWCSTKIVPPNMSIFGCCCCCCSAFLLNRSCRKHLRAFS